MGKWAIERFIVPAIFASLVSVGYARMIHAAFSTGFDLFLILLGAIGLFWTLGVIPRARTKASTESNRRLALEQLVELSRKGNRLLAEAPRTGATISDFVKFWNDDIGLWATATATILKDVWDKEAQDFFYSSTGLNTGQPVEQVSSEAKYSYLYLARYLQNLEQLRQTFLRHPDLKEH
jgi:hypothetical protein